MAKQRGPIKVGLVGLGRAGEHMHLIELKGKESMFQVVAVCDVIKERRERLAAQLGCKAYAKLQDLIADPEVELVDLATRSCDHVKHATLALKAGKHVFHEKPIAMNHAEALKLAAVAKRAKGRLFFRHNRRFGAAFQHAMEVIASGILGTVYDIRLEAGGYQRRNDWQTIKRCGGGLLRNWGPHLVDEALQFLQSPVKQIFCDVKLVAAVGDAEDHFRIILKGQNDCTAMLQVSNGTLNQPPRILIHGTRGALSVEMFEKEMWLKYLDPKQKLQKIKAVADTPGATTAFGNPEKLRWIEKTIPVKPKNGLDADQIWVAMYESLRHGKPFPITTEGSLEVMRILTVALGQKVKNWRDC